MEFNNQTITGNSKTVTVTGSDTESNFWSPIYVPKTDNEFLTVNRTASSKTNKNSYGRLSQNIDKRTKVKA